MATDIRTYLMERYNVDAECVKNGSEAEEDHAGLYTGKEDAWLVCGQMPNSIEHGWFFAGYTSNIEAGLNIEHGN